MQFIDLKAQQSLIREKIDKRIKKVLDHGQYIMGPEVFELEERLSSYVNVKHCISCSSGTDALLIPLMAMKIGPGDAVITTPFTYISTAEVIALVGATPIFCDIYDRTFNINPEELQKAYDLAISKNLKPKAIMPVDLFGLPARYRLIEKFAKDNDLKVIEDAAQGFGGNINEKKAGSFGDVAGTSFFPAKPLGCYGDGGAIFTNDDALAHTIRGIVNHGMYKRYHHDVVGVNSRLDSVQAAVLRTKLKNLEAYNSARQSAASKYDKAFYSVKNIITPVRKGDHVFHQYTLKVKNVDRDALAQFLNDNAIPCGVYYPIPLHSQKAYADERYNEADFTVTNQLIKEVISLPMHTELDDEQIAFITSKVIEFVNK